MGNPAKSRTVLIGTDQADKLFENLVPIDEIIPLLQTWLKRPKPYQRDTIYKWVANEGMPHQRIRGILYFPRDEVALWLKRTK